MLRASQTKQIMWFPIVCSIIVTTLFGVRCHHEDHIDACKKRDTCQYNDDADLAVCYCDEKCIQFKDCCKEYVISKNLTKPSNGVMMYSCVNVMTSDNQKYVKVGTFMVDRCMESGSACNITIGNLETMVPVSDRNQTFRNSDCATCNGVNKFTYWSISYEVPKYKEMNSLDFPSLLSDKSLNYLQKDVFPEEQYYLYPPIGFTPRFCPSDVTIDGREDTSDILYQNFVSCKNIMYKNTDTTFCDLNEIKCVDYNSDYVTRMNLTLQKMTRSIPKSLQILIKFGQRTNGEDSPAGEDYEGRSLTFMRKRTEIYIKLRMIKDRVENDNLRLVEEYIAAAIAYLRSSKYVLMVNIPTYKIEMTDGIEYSAILTFRSMTELYVSDIKGLMNLHLTLQYQETNGETFADGYLLTVPGNVSLSNPLARTKLMSMTTPEVSLVAHDDTMSCRNVSFVVKRRLPTGSEFGVGCLRDSIQNISGMNVVDVNVVTLTIILSLTRVA